MTVGVADGRKCVDRAAIDRQGRFANIEPIVEALRERGWTVERLAKNDLAEPRDVPGRDYDYERFWRTVARLAEELEALGLPPIFIKCAREYRYCDSNVDVLVPGRELRRVADRLVAGDWKGPGAWDRVEQALIEREKLKLPATRTGLIAAHLYGGVSWRYQSDIGMLREDGLAADPAQLVAVPLAECLDGLPADRTVWLPCDAAEFVLQAAHVAFENYRLTLGEALHFQLLKRRAADAWPAARQLAASYGCTAALDLLDRESERACRGLFAHDPADWPRTLPIDGLMPALTERGRVLSAQRRPLAAAGEVLTASAVYLAVSGIRRLRRIRRGVEDYR